jgi:hypothetical protein
MAIAAAVVWREALQAPPAREPMCPPKDDAVTYPGLLVTCSGGYHVAVVSVHGENKMFCQPIPKGEL